MANIKVSEMDELTNPENLASTYTYVETEGDISNTYNKISLQTIRDNISGHAGTIEDPTPFGVFFDNTSPIKLKNKTFALPIDCFIVSSGPVRDSVGLLKVADNRDEERTGVQSSIKRIGGYYHAGQIIEIGDEYYDIFPLENGNIDSSAVIQYRNISVKDLASQIGSCSDTYIRNYLKIYGCKYSNPNTALNKLRKRESISDYWDEITGDTNTTTYKGYAICFYSSDSSIGTGTQQRIISVNTHINGHIYNANLKQVKTYDPSPDSDVPNTQRANFITKKLSVDPSNAWINAFYILNIEFI